MPSDNLIRVKCQGCNKIWKTTAWRVFDCKRCGHSLIADPTGRQQDLSVWSYQTFSGASNSSSLNDVDAPPMNNTPPVVVNCGQCGATHRRRVKGNFPCKSCGRQLSTEPEQVATADVACRGCDRKYTLRMWEMVTCEECGHELMANPFGQEQDITFRDQREEWRRQNELVAVRCDRCDVTYQKPDGVAFNCRLCKKLLGVTEPKPIPYPADLDKIWKNFLCLLAVPAAVLVLLGVVFVVTQVILAIWPVLVIALAVLLLLFVVGVAEAGRKNSERSGGWKPNMVDALQMLNQMNDGPPPSDFSGGGF